MKEITLKKEDIENLFYTLSDVEISSVLDTIEHRPDIHYHMGVGYLLAVHRCRQILKSIMNDVEECRKQE